MQVGFGPDLAQHHLGPEGLLTSKRVVFLTSVLLDLSFGR